MSSVMFFAVVVSLAAGYFWYRYYAAKEKILISRLEQMLWDARQGRFHMQEISEYEVSALENEFKHFLDDSCKSTEEQKKQKNLVQELISDIAHQTLTPVSNLKIYSELLKETETEHVQLVHTIAEQTDKLDFLIQSLVKLSRMEQGMIQVHPMAESLAGLLQEIEQDYRMRALDAGICLKVEHSALQAVFDQKWTAEAIGNLVDNALKYTKKGGQVEIRVEQYSFFVRIDIQDTGIGIAEEEIPKIFGRFYRSMAVEDEPGSGIGLFLAREMLRMQKGYIKVSSKIGKGSVFSVFLPTMLEENQEAV